MKRFMTNLTPRKPDPGGEVDPANLEKLMVELLAAIEDLPDAMAAAISEARAGEEDAPPVRQREPKDETVSNRRARKASDDDWSDFDLNAAMEPSNA